MKQISLLFLCFLANQLLAQEIDFQRRYSFARSYFGVELPVYHQAEPSSYLSADSTVAPFDRSGVFAPSINIGATHFWGHADFYISIPTSSISLGKDKVKNSIAPDVITGMRIYPWAIQPQGLRPYVSYKFAPITLKQYNLQDQPYHHTRVKSWVGLGVGWQTKRLYVYGSYERLINASTDVFIAPTQTVASSFPKAVLTLGVNVSLDFTRNANSRPIEMMDSVMRKENKWGWFAAAGPSSAFILRDSEYLKKYYPYLDQRGMPNVFWELTAGHHFSRRDFIISANFRNMKTELEAFDKKLSWKYRSFGIEGYKFLFDYHGFAPFAGFGAMRDRVTFDLPIETGLLSESRVEAIGASFVFGWDIRPGRRADLWLLRTNLRYRFKGGNSAGIASVPFRGLEVNFIQFVIYPQRFGAYKAVRLNSNPK